MNEYEKTPNLEECLWVDPFDGDESDVVVTSDKIVTGRKDYPHCQICHGPIANGERHRARSEINREVGKRMTFRFCAPCCVAMIGTDDEDSDPAERMAERYAIGEAARNMEPPK